MDVLRLQLLTLGATLAIELPIMATLAPSERRAKVVSCGLWLNLATHSAASAVLWSNAVSWWLLEAIVIFLEALALSALASLAAPRAFTIAVLANSMSALCGRLWLA